MTTTFFDSALADQSWSGLSGLKTALVEPVLLAGAAFFWVAVLPFIAISLMGVKVWDTLVSLASGTAGRPNPLVLRRGLAKGTLVGRSSVGAARA